MLEYGYNDYKIYVGEHLGNPAIEKVTTLTLEEATQRDFDYPNCVILSKGNSKEIRRKGDSVQSTDNKTPKLPDSLDNKILRQRTFGIPDASFDLLDGREKMITKMPIRLLTLQALDLPQRHVLWDIGFCTGSVSIEARLQFPHLHIEAFEIRPECEAIIQENVRRFGAPGINVHIGDFLETDITALPCPDAVFIGGHGGQLKAIMAKVLSVLTDDGVIVFNSVVAPKVTVDSKKLWDKACEELVLQQEPPLHIQLNDNHPITILKCRR
jgi:precorrin-6Y C5,15-methyltransferase (decarboxylating)